MNGGRGAGRGRWKHWGFGHSSMARMAYSSSDQSTGVPRSTVVKDSQPPHTRSKSGHNGTQIKYGYGVLLTTDIATAVAALRQHLY